MIGAVLRRALAFLFALVCMLGAARPASADTNVALFKSFSGNVNFVGTQRTLRTSANTVNPCAVTPATTATTATLSGIPAGATILSAQLYWAGSGGSTARDYSITFEGVNFTAPASRQYFSATVGYDFFSGAADVTAQVIAKRNGTYSFSNLTVVSGSPYCAVEAVLGGWALAVVYSDPAETFRVLNIYEGFQYIRSGNVTLTLSNFSIPPLTAAKTGRIGHVTWEGDSSISGGEDLLFNNLALVDTLNPSGNQFNSASNVNNDPNSYGIDYDVYTLTDPFIKQGQTSATTIYRTGTDLVLLNAEIIAVPNTPVADLGITMARDQNLMLGQSALFTLAVKNNGPEAEPGPIVITDTLPATLGVQAVGGENWNCVITGQTVKCTYLGQLEVGASAPPIYLLVMVNANNPATVSNTASVAGTLFDNQAGNDTASDTATIGNPGYVFTDAICTNNVAFGSAQPCKFINLGNRIAGVPIDKIFITNLNASGVPTFINALFNTTMAVKFALSCQNPVAHANTQANFPDASTLLPLCASNSATPTNWTGLINFIFPKSSPSISTSMVFDYADAGRIKLFMSDSNNKTGASGPFVMRPDTFEITAVSPINPGWQASSVTTAANTPVFAQAGQPFTIEVRATTRKADPANPGKVLLAKNYGNETPIGRGVTLMRATEPDYGANDPENGNTRYTDMTYIPDLTGTPGAFSKGISSANNFVFDEVGIIAVRTTLPGGDYLGAGNIDNDMANIGRFIAHHFDTVVPVGAPVLPCSTKMTCATTLSGMVYSTQRFPATVTARHTNGTVLLNYNGKFARATTLQAWDGLASERVRNPQNPQAAVNPPAVQGGIVFSDTGTSAAPADIALAAFTKGVASPKVSYTLSAAYSNTQPRATGIAAPTAIYLRAIDTDKVTSLRPAAGATNPSVEGGVMIVNGRLQLANAYGSELLGLPIAVTAQFWNGSSWVTSETDSVSIPTTTGITFENCINALRSTAAAPGNCKTALSAAASATALTSGTGTIRLNAPGKGNTGSGDFYLTGPSWLPSTKGRATFGVYKSGPVTYIREVY